jgi:hypothetical protein
MSLVSRAVPRLVLLPMVLLVSVCGGNDTPSAPSTPPPTAAPVPTPTPTPIARTSCDRLGPGPGDGSGSSCPRETPSFQQEVDAAIDKIRAEHPELFEGRNVLSVGQYLVGVIKNLDDMGLCAGYDGEELQVKNSNDFNDQYHILTSNFQYRDGTGSYRVTCYPAAFPIPQASPGQVPGCSLPGSRDVGCGREKPSYLPQVDAAIQKVADTHPEIIDKTDIRGGNNWYRVLNVDAYAAAMVAELTRVGLCAFWDGHEMAVKGENRFSDQYDILAGDGYTRRGEGSYRTTCYPAAF